MFCAKRPFTTLDSVVCISLFFFALLVSVAVNLLVAQLAERSVPEMGPATIAAMDPSERAYIRGLVSSAHTSFMVMKMSLQLSGAFVILAGGALVLLALNLLRVERDVAQLRKLVDPAAEPVLPQPSRVHRLLAVVGGVSTVALFFWMMRLS